jgi:hypothetical protein
VDNYIKMCEKHPKLREMWKPSIGDRYKSKFEPKYTLIVQSLLFPSNDYKNELFWLPRIEDLIGMVDWEELKTHSQMEYFNNFKNRYCKEMNWSLITFSEIFNTWDKVWLAFVSNELWNLKWDGNEWK